MRLALSRVTESKKEVKREDRQEKVRVAYHTVKKGETLVSIADKYDMELRTLKNINRLKKSKIHSGMKLKITSNTTVKPSEQG